MEEVKNNNINEENDSLREENKQLKEDYLKVRQELDILTEKFNNHMNSEKVDYSKVNPKEMTFEENVNWCNNEFKKIFKKENK